MPVEGIGCPIPRTRNNSTPLDFIEYYQETSTTIIDIVGPLYSEGLSISDIADQTGLKRHSIWKSLRTQKTKLRPQASVPFERWRKGRGKTKARPPYGYCYFQGEVIKDPMEYPVLQLIHNLWKQGRTISSIIDKLAERGIKSRMNKPWSYNVIKATIKRFGEGSVGHLTSRSIPTNEKSFS